MKERFERMESIISTLGTALAEHQMMLIRMTANQHAGSALLRHFLAEQGFERGTLNQQYHTAYGSGLSRYEAQLREYEQTGDAMKFLKSLTFPDDVQSN